jgi:hypothetical protein
MLCGVPGAPGAVEGARGGAPLVICRGKAGARGLALPLGPGGGAPCAAGAAGGAGVGVPRKPWLGTNGVNECAASGDGCVVGVGGAAVARDGELGVSAGGAAGEDDDWNILSTSALLILLAAAAGFAALDEEGVVEAGGGVAAAARPFAGAGAAAAAIVPKVFTP